MSILNFDSLSDIEEHNCAENPSDYYGFKIPTWNLCLNFPNNLDDSNAKAREVREFWTRLDALRAEDGGNEFSPATAQQYDAEDFCARCIQDDQNCAQPEEPVPTPPSENEICNQQMEKIIKSLHIPHQTIKRHKYCDFENICKEKSAFNREESQEEAVEDTQWLLEQLKLFETDRLTMNQTDRLTGSLSRNTS